MLRKLMFMDVVPLSFRAPRSFERLHGTTGAPRGLPVLVRRVARAPAMRTDDMAKSMTHDSGS